MTNSHVPKTAVLIWTIQASELNPIRVALGVLIGIQLRLT